ncbi:MAG: 4-amino-4-deoxychorismate lyase [Phenylobacterium sp.]|uniref:aminotransferase class IV n=1 Tax=Phenylobacterium sp. TaxID=1871053 RepID=UPI0025E5622A|nr:aminotransferase class IV [Phenylobacterium sp.]MBA4013555.1 4-amino-4-deoxychorismate lyase [Phenylobacterium sp.]
MIPLDDRGLLLGDGLFETLLAVDGVLVAPGPHLDRMAAGCATLGLPPLDRGEAARVMAAALAGLEATRVAVRLTLTAGSGGRGLDRPDVPAVRLIATAAPAPASQEPADLITSTVRRNDLSPAARLKTLSYIDNVLARAEARGAGVDEALMLNTRGDVACAAAANVFWLWGGRLYTPQLDCGVLAGTMRAQVIAAATGQGLPVVETRSGVAELARADAAFLTNSLIGVRPVRSLDGFSWEPSTLVERLAAAVS